MPFSASNYWENTDNIELRTSLVWDWANDITRMYVYTYQVGRCKSLYVSRGMQSITSQTVMWYVINGSRLSCFSAIGYRFHILLVPWYRNCLLPITIHVQHVLAVTIYIKTPPKNFIAVHKIQVLHVGRTLLVVKLTLFLWPPPPPPPTPPPPQI